MNTHKAKKWIKLFGIPTILVLALATDPYWSLSASQSTSSAPLFEVIESADDQSSQCTPVYSLYNPKTSKHLFSTDEVERKTLAASGWTDEGICFGSAMESEPPVYRFYNRKSKEHLYTANEKEAASLEQAGWDNEGIAFYSTTNTNGIPVYRLVNPHTEVHHYTSDEEEMNALLKTGWKSEGKAFSVLEPYVFVEENGQIKAYDTYDQPVSGILRLRTGTYYFDPANHNAMYTGWIQLPLSILDIAPQTAEFKWVQTHYEVPEMPEVAWEEVDYFENSEETTLWTWSEGELIEISESQESEKEESIETDVSFNASQESLHESLLQKNSSSTSVALEALNLEKDQDQTASISDSNGLIELYFQEDGRMAKGETTLEDGVHFFHKTSGQHLRSKWVRYGSKTCYFDENGIRLSGTNTLDGQVYHFDEKTGAMSLDLQGLLDQAVAYIEAHQYPDEEYSLGLRIVDSSQSAFWNNQSQQSASVMKLFVMGAIYENYDAACQYAGKNVIDSNLYSMISVSSNEAWTYLVVVLGQGDYAKGIEVLDTWNEKHGYTQTRMEGVPYGNYTSVKDCGKILEDIEKGKLKNSEAMKELIQHQSIAGRLRRGLPSDVAAGNKPGWLSDTENDTVIVWTPKGSYVISLLSTNLRSTSNAQNIMRQVSAMTYEWMLQNLDSITPIQQ